MLEGGRGGEDGTDIGEEVVEEGEGCEMGGEKGTRGEEGGSVFWCTCR